MSSSIKPNDVLKFWFSRSACTESRSLLSSSTWMMSQMPKWFGISSSSFQKIPATEQAQIDDSCRFLEPALEKAFTGVLSTDPDWKPESPDDYKPLLAQTILLDQISRNIYRGSTSAFSYDNKAIICARKLHEMGMVELEGVELSECMFAFMPLTHSEELVDHELNTHLAKRQAERWPGNMSSETVKQAEDHAIVIRRFGRYPHRNKLMGREGTPEEIEYLSDVENLPAWAKSQM